ncbi:MAG: transcriptional repressor [Candidatus Omnitrophota bacterium]|jgi:Fur family ferric uptake transcriptional regulator|nr:MAG: transcriptional repressor [Candidatus Omnitrophota bacterium]
MKKEVEIFNNYINRRRFRHTPQRIKILDVFLETEGHVSFQELYRLVKKKHPEIGLTTVYRSMKLFSECGLCSEIDFGDGVLRFEHKYNHKHHDHLICTKCGQLIEVVSPRLEKMQEAMAKKHGFVSLSHKLEIFGICSSCYGLRSPAR